MYICHHMWVTYINGLIGTIAIINFMFWKYIIIIHLFVTNLCHSLGPVWYSSSSSSISSRAGAQPNSFSSTKTGSLLQTQLLKLNLRVGAHRCILNLFFLLCICTPHALIPHVGPTCQFHLPPPSTLFSSLLISRGLPRGDAPAGRRGGTSARRDAATSWFGPRRSDDWDDCLLLGARSVGSSCI